MVLTPRLRAGLAAVVLALAACSGGEPAVTPSSGTPSTEATPTDAATTGTPSPTETEATDAAGPDDDVDEGDDGLGETDVEALLSGDAVVDGDGDATGSGRFGATLTPLEATAEMCWVLVVADLSSPVTAAHVHRGGPDETGSVVVPLEVPVDGRAEGCATIDGGLAAELFTDPSGFYVNVHTEDLPSSAIRGQLALSS